MFRVSNYEEYYKELNGSAGSSDFFTLVQHDRHAQRSNAHSKNGFRDLLLHFRGHFLDFGLGLVGFQQLISNGCLLLDGCTLNTAFFLRVCGF